MPSIPLNGIDLYYEVHGAEAAPPVVFLHGVSGNHLSWWQQVPAFEQDYRCITVDQRGFGRSLDVPGGPGRAAFVSDLTALLDHLGIQDCSLVAQSMGGNTAFPFARQYPQRVRALVMADTILGIRSRALLELRQRLIRDGRADTGHPIHPGLWQREPNLAFLYYQIQGLNPPQLSIEERRRRAMTEHVEEEDDLARFAVPTLFLFGADDAQMPSDLGRLAHELIPGSRYAEVADAGHSVYFERADEFNTIVRKFLAEVAASAAAPAR
jgi:pimeloyl-ACP methyl ester carboxylesterase